MGLAITMPRRVELLDDDGCFVCGRANPVGLRLEFAFEGEDYVTYFVPGKQHQGYVGIAHGGIIATVLDEVMARLVYVKQLNAVTAEITIRYKKPARIGKRLRFAARIDSANSRIVQCSAEANDESGVLVAVGMAKMLRV